MHERSVLAALIRKLEELARSEDVERITVVRVRLGALSHFTPEHFREHFEEASRGSVSEGAALEIEVGSDIQEPGARDVWIRSVDVGGGAA